jgi:hypothetical protein
MAKIAILIPVLAIEIDTVSAWQHRLQSCIGEPQYYYNDSSYYPAGVLGTDYVCASGGGTCTYIGIPGDWEVCQKGIYTPLHNTRALPTATES